MGVRDVKLVQVLLFASSRGSVVWRQREVDKFSHTKRSPKLNKGPSKSIAQAAASKKQRAVDDAHSTLRLTDIPACPNRCDARAEHAQGRKVPPNVREAVTGACIVVAASRVCDARLSHYGYLSASDPADSASAQRGTITRGAENSFEAFVEPLSTMLNPSPRIVRWLWGQLVLPACLYVEGSIQAPLASPTDSREPVTQRRLGLCWGVSREPKRYRDSWPVAGTPTWPTSNALCDL
jgi:hypothetical protein